jgi:arabinofuranosyltransferase
MAYVPENRLSHRDLLILAGVTLFSMGAYLAFSGIYHSIGFPLDDAWIHQTFARNLALRGEWSFLPGKSSGASTSPLWSALLAIGFLVKLAPYAWAYILGGAALWGLAVLGEIIARRVTASYQPQFPWIGMVLVLEWHLVWAAGSGMETLIYSILVIAVLGLIVSGSKKYFGMGVLIGLSVWTRPDGILLLGAVALSILVNEKTWSERVKGLLRLSLSAGSLLALYLFFNLAVSGSPLPNTFYAKQAEYAVYLQLPFLQRFGGEALQPLIGVGVILLPGLILVFISAIRRKRWGLLIAFGWLVGFLCLYAWRLPVTYQHGRYVIPAMPVYCLLGLLGLVEFKLKDNSRWQWIILSFWKLSAGIVLVLFWGRGAFAYAQDVAVINTEMVNTAKWVAANVPINDLVAAHDIGAMGYFSGHNLVDLAGLVSPEVIPFLRNETRLADYLAEKRVNYLVAFPDWYPQLTSNLSIVFSTGAPYSRVFGEQNMAVYRWPGP